MTPVISYRITNKYLVVHVEKPKGLTGSVPVTNEDQLFSIYQTYNTKGCYMKIDMFFNLNGAELDYLGASFKAPFTKEYSIIREGNYTYEALPDSNEGYLEYQKVRQYVMSQQNNRQ